jgi:nuclease-like protein/UvrD-like helicase family protein/AAA domain-containing protein
VWVRYDTNAYGDDVSLIPDDSAAWPSALGEAAAIGAEIDSVRRQIRQLTELLGELRRRQRRWETGGRGEQAVIRVLVGMDAAWHVLADRRWPGTRRANIDVILVGPGGVFVIDVKAWRAEARVEHGRLWRGDADAQDAVVKLVDQTSAVEEVLAGVGLAPTEVVPLLVLAGRRGVRAQVDRVLVLGEKDLIRELVRWGVRLPPELVERLIQTLDRECPPMPVGDGGASGGGPVAASDRKPDPPGWNVLVSLEELQQALREADQREPIEAWMTWLHPDQAQQVNREFSGPARIRGGAGTGKTVLALHRANYLASQGRRVLFTSFIRTLPRVHQALFARLAPARQDRVTFRSVHALAGDWLQARAGQQLAKVDESAAGICFDEAWDSVRPRAAGTWFGRAKKYWHDEVSVVIKGRGLADFEEYARLARVGRRAALSPGARADVWQLYEDYSERLATRGILDWADTVRIARDRAREQAAAGGDTGFDAVIVDEVQDLTCVGLQFLHALAGDRPDGLLMVGDGQQSVYPGGFTLAEAGISVVGRSTVLTRNYRNGERILRHALGVVAGEEFNDLDTGRVGGLRDPETARPGGSVVEFGGALAGRGAAMCARIRELHERDGVRYGEMAVLAPDNPGANRWREVLKSAGIPVIGLEKYAGRPRDQVKVGTFYRAKGLEFAQVFIPDRDRYPRARSPRESGDAYRERVELERRVLFVAMTRARDGLWLGTR